MGTLRKERKIYLLKYLPLYVFDIMKWYSLTEVVFTREKYIVLLIERFVFKLIGIKLKNPR